MWFALHLIQKYFELFPIENVSEYNCNQGHNAPYQYSSYQDKKRKRWKADKAKYAAWYRQYANYQSESRQNLFVMCIHFIMVLVFCVFIYACL